MFLAWEIVGGGGGTSHPAPSYFPCGDPIQVQTDRGSILDSCARGGVLKPEGLWLAQSRKPEAKSQEKSCSQDLSCEGRR